jgi:thymidylate synthase ThyX
MKIVVYDEFAPEDAAMLQALYSRSASSVTEHAEKVKQTGSGKFMEKYYVGYGHASIADCGSTTVFIEGVSMLAAKAVQDWPLYSGQETSSRYIDMSKQALVDPVGTKESKQILARWVDFYTNNQDAVAAHLRQRYPIRAGENPDVYEKAIKARVFDTLRGFLPAGITTQLSWHTNLRQASDKLALLVHHPLEEISSIGKVIAEQLKAKYPHSFGHVWTPEQAKYRELLGQKWTYFNTKLPVAAFALKTTIKPAELAKYKEVIAKRPAKTGLPHFVSDLGQVTFEFPLDFGSFRDLQRHRHGVCRMPLLSAAHGFHNWYLDELPKDLAVKAKKLIAEQKAAIGKLKTTPLNKQYYYAMGFNVACKVTYALPAAVYVAELRSGKLVHPTLRVVAQRMIKALQKKFPVLRLHGDLTLADWDIRRGLQDIKEKR